MQLSLLYPLWLSCLWHFEQCFITLLWSFLYKNVINNDACQDVSSTVMKPSPLPPLLLSSLSQYFWVVLVTLWPSPFTSAKHLLMKYVENIHCLFHCAAFFITASSCLSCPVNAIELDQIPWASWVQPQCYSRVDSKWRVLIWEYVLCKFLLWLSLTIHCSKLFVEEYIAQDFYHQLVQIAMQCCSLFCNFWLTPNYMIWFSFYSIFTASGLIFIARSSDIHPLQIFQYFQHRVCSSAFMVYT